MKRVIFGKLFKLLFDHIAYFLNYFICRIVNRETKNKKELGTIFKIEKDITVFNDCVFKTEMDIEIPRQINEKKAYIIHPIDNCNNHHLTVGVEISNCEKEYQCEICNKRFHDKYNLEVHKSLHANIKKFNCITCGEQFFELNGFKSHLISHIDNNIKLLENQFIQECNDVDDCNSNLWYAL